MFPTMLPLDRLLGSKPRHSEAQVLGWAKRLRYFYFMGEVLSGHFETYEELKMRLDYSGRDDLIRLLEALGLLRYGVGPPPNPVREGGERRVTDHPDLVQPKHCSIVGSKCFVWIESAFIRASCDAHFQGLSESHVEDALRIEAQLDKLGLQSRVNRSIAKDFNCVSAENFPELFAGPGG